MISGKVIAFDTETTGLSTWQGDRPFAFSFCNENGETAYVEFDVNPKTREVIYRPKPLAKIKRVLEDPSSDKVGHNLKFDVAMANSLGIEVKGKLHDTMIMAHVCNSRENSFSLKKLAKKYAGIDDKDQAVLQKVVTKLRRKAKAMGWKIADDYREMIDGVEKRIANVAADYWLPRMIKKKHSDMLSDSDFEACETYATLDAVRTMVLFKMYDELMDDLKVRNVYNFEMYDLWPEVRRIVDRGIRIDAEVLQNEIDYCMEQYSLVKEHIVKQAWDGCNIDSHVHLRKFLYDKLKLPINTEYKTPTGLPGTNVKALLEMSNVPIVQDIFRYRAYVKGYGYFASYKRLMVRDDRYKCMALHPDLRQIGPATGRFACASPNLQQVTTESGRSLNNIDCRPPFGPRKGYVWLLIDYKGMEVRIFADVAQEPNMLKAIADGTDIHEYVTNLGWGGEGNEAGMWECIHAFALDGSEFRSNEKLKAQWKRWGIKNLYKLDMNDKRKIVDDYLKEFDYNIVQAQNSVGVVYTKNKAKMVTFAKIFGGGPKAVKHLLHVSLNEAIDFMDQYDRTFPRITEFAMEMEEEALANGYIKTRWDRRLTIDPDRTYSCVNYLVQGSAADLLKRAIVKCGRFFRKNGIDGHILLPIHDELVFEIRREELTLRLVLDLCRMMEDTEGKLNVSMPTEPSVAKKSWNVKTKLKFISETRKVA